MQTVCIDARGARRRCRAGPDLTDEAVLDDDVAHERGAGHGVNRAPLDDQRLCARRRRRKHGERDE